MRPQDGAEKQDCELTAAKRLAGPPRRAPQPPEDTTDAHGKILYRNAFATTFALTAETVVEVLAAGRSRWKIENENNNVLKTKGDHFEHNDGHGQQHLSALLASLIILAFLTHTVLEWMDDSYRLLRQKRPSRQRLFNDIRTLTTYLCFDSGQR